MEWERFISRAISNSIGASLSIGAALGALFTGLLLETLGWRLLFALFALPSAELVARFRVAANGEKNIDAVTGTDGIAVAVGNFGPDYPEGLFVVQDDDNSGAAQNYLKLVSWAAVRSRIPAEE